MYKHVKGIGGSYLAVKKPAKKVRIPKGREQEFVNALRTFKDNNKLGEKVFIDCDGYICGTINGVWAFACYCEGHTQASLVDIDQVQFAKKTGVDIENLFFK